MAKKKNEKKVEEIIEILEEDIPKKESNGKSWTEEIEMAGKDVTGFLKKVWTESTIRRVVVRNEEGDTLLNLPVGAGVVGLIFPSLILPVAVGGAAVVWATKCKITLERREVDVEDVSI